MKRFACGALAAAMLAVPALAAESETVTQELNSPVSLVQPRESRGAYLLNQWNAQFPVRYEGVAAQMEEGSLMLKDALEDGQGDIRLHLSDQTRILDAVTGEPVAFEELEEGEKLAVWTSPKTALSLPPQASAQLILCNLPQEGSFPAYVEIQQVEHKEDGRVSILTSDDTVLHLSGETQLFPYLTRQAITLDSLRPGDRILAWYDVTLESYPAQAYPEKVMVFAYGYEGWLAAETADGLAVNGQELDQDGLVVEDKLMLPVRALAEALGLEVRWNAEAPDQVTVAKPGTETPLYELTLGSKDAVLEGDMVVEMDLPAVARAGVTYVDANALIDFHGLKLEGQWPSL